MDEIDRRLLQIIQKEFPLIKRPFSLLAQQVGIKEEEALQRITRLKEQGYIRRIGAILNLEGWGRCSTLVAMKVPTERVEEVGNLVSRYDGVSHNYLRGARDGSCPYNLWFTLSAPSQEELQKNLSQISSEAGLPLVPMPAQKKFKIGVEFNLFPQEEEP